MVQPTTAKFGKMIIQLGTPTGADPAAVTVTNLSKSAVGGPAVCTVAVADITKFQNGMSVVIAGATGTGLTNANGTKVIASVNSPVNTFQLVGVDTSAAAAAQTTGVTADPPKANVYAAPCGLTTKNLVITKNLQEVTIPDCDDPDAPAWIARDVQNLSVTISGDGVAAAESVPDWNNAATNAATVPMKVDITFTKGIKTFIGNFHVDSLTFGAQLGNRVTLGFNAQSDGEVYDVWTPIP